MIIFICAYFIIGLLLGVLAWHAAGKHVPINPVLPKWVTLAFIMLLWPVVLALYVKLSR